MNFLETTRKIFSGYFCFYFQKRQLLLPLAYKLTTHFDLKNHSENLSIPIRDANVYSL